MFHGKKMWSPGYQGLFISYHGRHRWRLKALEITHKLWGTRKGTFANSCNLGNFQNRAYRLHRWTAQCWFGKSLWFLISIFDLQILLRKGETYQGSVISNTTWHFVYTQIVNRIIHSFLLLSDNRTQTIRWSLEK